MARSSPTHRNRGQLCVSEDTSECYYMSWSQQLRSLMLGVGARGSLLVSPGLKSCGVVSLAISGQS